MSRKEYGSARATIEGSGEWRSGAGGRWSAGRGDTRYLCLVNNHARYARSHYAKEVSDTSLSMKNVSRAVIYDLPIPLLAEQHRIVAKVDELLALFDPLEAQIVDTRPRVAFSWTHCFTRRWLRRTPNGRSGCRVIRRHPVFARQLGLDRVASYISDISRTTCGPNHCSAS